MDTIAYFELSVYLYRLVYEFMDGNTLVKRWRACSMTRERMTKMAQTTATAHVGVSLREAWPVAGDEAAMLVGWLGLWFLKGQSTT